MPDLADQVLEEELAEIWRGVDDEWDRLEARDQEISEEWSDPLEWCTARGWRPWPGQIRMMEAASRYRRVCIVGANGVGKGNFFAWRTYHWLSGPGHRRTITTANTNHQVRENTWHEINECHRRHGWRGDCMVTMWRLDGNEAVGHTSDDQLTLQGRHAGAVLLEVDEGSGHRLDETWDQLRTLPSGDGQTIFAGNFDRRVGVFSKACEGKMGFHVVRVTAIEAAEYQEEHGRIPGLTHWEKIAEWANDLAAEIEGLEGWARQATRGEDLPPLPADLLERVKAFAGEQPVEGEAHWTELDAEAQDWWRVHVLALKPSGVLGGWFPSELIEEARQRRPDEPDTGVWRVGVDVAGQGDAGDWTVAYGRLGLYLERIMRSRSKDEVEIVDELDRWAKRQAEFRSAAAGETLKPSNLVEFAVDATGIGSGVATLLSRRGYHVDRVHFGGAPKNDERFANRATEGYYHLSRHLQGGGQCPDLDELQEDLEAVTTDWRRGTQGRDVKALVPKAQRKESLGRSPDDGDAAMLTTIPRVEPQEAVGWPT